MLEIGEQISVIAAFGGSVKLKPMRFKWSGRQIDIKEITYEWSTLNGQNKLLHFSVTDGSTLYELSFDTGLIVWRLEGVET
ncbi:MAG: hypothetical protein HZB30_04865 [Nitrospirae bacterium]|nr:hypothetical protein [Nitrospirota bacterium]